MCHNSQTKVKLVQELLQQYDTYQQTLGPKVEPDSSAAEPAAAPAVKPTGLSPKRKHVAAATSADTGSTKKVKYTDFTKAVSSKVKKSKRPSPSLARRHLVFVLAASLRYGDALPCISGSWLL